VTIHDIVEQPVQQIANAAYVSSRIRVAFSWSHLWVLKRMADGAVCWVADKTGKVHSGEGKLL